MNKIAFIGIILVCGLFSLQYSLLGQRSENSYTHLEPVAQKTYHNSTPKTRVQVVYIFPNDSLDRKQIIKSAEILL